MNKYKYLSYIINISQKKICGYRQPSNQLRLVNSRKPAMVKNVPSAS